MIAEMLLFLVCGGLLAIFQYARYLYKHPLGEIAPLSAFMAMFVIGGLLYGSVMWLIARYFF